MQRKILINDIEIFQPEKDLGYNLETTFSSDSTRTMDGRGFFTPLFTVEQLSYSASHVPADKAAELLQLVALGESFNLTYFSPYYGAWRTGEFYVGKGSLSIGTMEEDKEYMTSISFNMTGVDHL
ncbi:MAG: hypothetical protein KBT34_09920 [Prevotella sp.]|nr:hypothetical protein [Candidatus Prevotella equi]